MGPDVCDVCGTELRLKLHRDDSISGDAVMLPWCAKCRAFRSPA